MKIKNSNIIEILSTLNLLAGQKLPIKLSWRIETARNAIRPFAETAIKIVDQIKQDNAIKDSEGRPLMSKDKNGNDIPNTLLFDKDVLESLNRDIESVLNAEVEVENVEFKFEDFPDSLELTANEIRSLSKIIE
jgi:hypothetical protein